MFIQVHGDHYLCQFNNQTSVIFIIAPKYSVFNMLWYFLTTIPADRSKPVCPQAYLPQTTSSEQERQLQVDQQQFPVFVVRNVFPIRKLGPSNHVIYVCLLAVGIFHVEKMSTQTLIVLCFSIGLAAGAVFITPEQIHLSYGGTIIFKTSFK